MSIRTAIITISNSKSRGEGEDTGGAALAEWAKGIGAELIGRDLIPDDRDQIEARLRHWADVVTTPLFTRNRSTVTPHRFDNPERHRRRGRSEQNV